MTGLLARTARLETALLLLLRTLEEARNDEQLAHIAESLRADLGADRAAPPRHHPANVERLRA